VFYFRGGFDLFFVVVYVCLVVLSCCFVFDLGFAGVLGTGLAIMGSFGFVSLCGVSFVDIVGAMPFLILGNLTLEREGTLGGVLT
jgi:hypothetical protein